MNDESSNNTQYTETAGMEKASPISNIEPSATKERIEDKKNTGKNKSIPPANYIEFITWAYEGKNISQESKKAFGTFDIKTTEQERQELLALAHEKDKELRITLSLAEVVLEGAINSRNHEILLSFIENVASNFESLSQVATNTIFQSWLDNAKDNSDKLTFFEGQIKRLTTKSGKKLINTQLPASKINNLLCIAAIWLYFKKAADFSALISYLSRSAFDIKGESGNHIEAGAFAFAASMITSTKKVKFAYLLSMVSQTEQTLRNELLQKKVQASHLDQRLTQSRENNQELVFSLEHTKQENSALANTISELEAKLKLRDERALHTKIHHNDSIKKLRVRFFRLLEEEIAVVINNAKTANSRIEPNQKTAIVDYQLNDALEIIKRELTWLNS